MGIGSGILRLYYGTVSRLNITDSTALVSASNFGASGYVRSSGPGGGSGIKLQGLAAGSGSAAVDTGISVNRGNAGGTMLVLGCRNTGAGTATQGYVWLLKFHYDGNNLPSEVVSVCSPVALNWKVVLFEETKFISLIKSITHDLSL